MISVGFAFAGHALLIASMSAMVVAGTWLGSRILDRVDERTFVALYKLILTLVALRLVFQEGWRLVFAGG